MRMFRALSPLVLLLGVGIAMAQDVRYNYDRSADFSKFKTYKWVSVPGAAKVDDLTDRNILAALDAVLASKGLTKTDSDSAHLFVGYQVGLDQEKQFSAYSSGWGYGPGWYRGGWYGGGGGFTTGQTSTIYVGQLVFDMYDAASHHLVWRGIVSKTLDPKAKPDKQQKNLTKAATKLLKNYPPAGK